MNRWSCLLAVFICSPATAGPLVMTNRSEFETLTGSLPAQGFEVPFAASAFISFGDFTVTEESTAPDVSSRTDYFSSGERAMGFTWNGNGTFTFSFHTPITAFGADILDFGTCCGAETLTVTSESEDWIVTAATGTDRPRGNLQFFGIQTETPFSKLIFTSDEVSDNDLIVFDQVTYLVVQVPEPACLAMMAITGCCLILFARKRLR